MVRAAHRVQRDIPVMSYAELAARVARTDIEAKAHEIAALTHLDLPERARLMTAHVWALSDLSGPVVIMGFGSIPYPAVCLTDGALEDDILAAAKPFGL